MPVAVLDSLRVRARIVALDARWAIRSSWRRARGHHGACKTGEASARASHLTELWERTWPLADPLGHELRVAYADRWVRFHSLPESKRYADDASESGEILRRHRTVLAELRGSTGTADLWAIAPGWDWRDSNGGWAKDRLPGAWPWRIGQIDDDCPAYFWAASGFSDSAVDALLLEVADDRGRVLFGAPDLAWLYCPYDGGADVLLPTVAERDALKARHTDWLSTYPGGL
ncbi:MAG TPA: hypothetical protein VJ872_20290 [Nocardioides sp.]|nr:hypothetical protein [Nocardioides sp.]